MRSKELEELKAIKKLLMLSLITKAGVNSEDLAVILGVDGSTIRRMFPMKRLKRLQSQGK